jgi:hypothetical protein
VRRSAALGLLVVLMVAGCSTVPTSSPTVQITQAAARPSTDVGIEPLPPEKDATPDEIVRGFIDAAASTVHGHPVARKYLSPQAARSWSDESGITVITSPSAVTTDTGAVQHDTGAVSLRANEVGTVDTHGVFSVGTERLYSRSFTLVQVKGQWRISDPPDGLLLQEPDFQRLYDDREAYFIDPTGQRLVPDPRYLITGESQPTTLVQRLLDGPSAALADGVRNPLAGAQLRRAVTVTPRTVTVDLSGVGNQPAPVLSEICAQIVWTLAQLSLANVEVLLDGQPVDVDGVPTVQNTGDWESFDPEGVPVGSVGLYVDKGAVRTASDGKPIPGTAGTGTYSLSSAAVATDPKSGEPDTMAGVSGIGGRATLRVGQYGKDLASVLVGNTLTAPTVAATREEFWVVRDGAAVFRVSAGGQPQAVAAPSLPGLGHVSSLRLSPDGVRAAVVIDGTIYVGTVVRSDDGVSLHNLQAIAPSLTLVADVAWDSSATLLALAGDASQQRMVPYQIGIDGFGLEPVATSGLPGQPTAIGAVPGRQPLVSAGGTIWQQSGGTWVTLIRGQEPLPGRAPFYPL